MEFRCAEKDLRDKQSIIIKVAADPAAPEPQWLAACSALEKNPQILRVLPESRSKSQNKVLEFVFAIVNSAVLSIGQIFMVAASACAAGSVAACLFGQSYERVMYHCGPQDTIVGVFAIGAIPFFWLGWHLKRHKFIKLAILLAIGPVLAILLASVVTGLAALFIAGFIMCSLAAYLYSGAFISSFKTKLPRVFKPTFWLSLCYLSAILLLTYEFIELNLVSDVGKIDSSSLSYAGGTLLAFAFLPALLTVFQASTKRISSAIGLAIIGQWPLLLTVGLYCLSNAIMLLCAQIFGCSALAEYFANTAPGGMTPDFDLASSNQTELIWKFLSSCGIFVALIISTLSGSLCGVVWNRHFHKARRG